MMRGFIPFICCVTIILAFGCSEDDTVTRPEKHSTLTLDGDPIDIVYITSEDTVRENYSDTFTVSWGDLGWQELPYMYGDKWMDEERAVTEELVVGNDGTIAAIIKDCPTGHTWSMIYSDPADLRLSEMDSVVTRGDTG